MADTTNTNQEEVVSEGAVSEENSEGSQQQESTPQYTELEQKAMEQGWVPEEQYAGSGKWRSAEEFLDRGELFSKIDELNRRDKAKDATLNELKKHLKRVRETEFNRALHALKSQKAQALEDGDHGRVVEIDDQIANTKVQAAQEMHSMDQPAPQPAAPTPQFVAWVNRNSWYQHDRVMKAAADAIGEELVSQGENNPTRVLEKVEERIRKEFPNRFTNPNRTKTGAVESSSRGNGSGSKGSSFQLTAEETQVMNKLVRHGVMTKDEYIADIKASRGA